MQIVYFSSFSNTTHKFIGHLGLPASRLPLRPSDEELIVTEPFILITPTYGAGGRGGAVPKQVVRFLNSHGHGDLIRGVIGAGNKNFGDAYCIAADIISNKCRTPILYRFELLGTPEDIEEIRSILSKLA
jgi:protein involved in ribonucleotide reduction